MKLWEAMMEQGGILPEDEARKEGEVVRSLAEDLAGQDHVQRPEAAHYQEAARTVDARATNPQRMSRPIDRPVAESQESDLEDLVK